jgi:signal transduction histidine kinase
MLKNPDFNDAILDWLNDYASQGIVTTDYDFIICGWNCWLEEKAGRTAASVIGRSLFEIFPDLVERGLDRLYHNALDGQVSMLAQRFHRYLVKLPGRPEFGLAEMQQAARIAPLVCKGMVIGTITAIHDVSERVVRENELMAAREQADSANKAKDRFLAVLSHDLRTPLTAILGWARIFRDRPGDEKIVRRGTDIIERNAAIQLQLIEEILDMSRIAAEKLELNLEPVEVRQIVHDALETLEPAAIAKGITLLRSLPNEPQIAKLDPKRCQQIIWNLVSNSLKFTPQGGSVTATLKYESDGFELRIADTGKGIDPESLPHLFEPLWQAEGSASDGGLGLGLAIVRNLVELHGGSIHAESSGTGQGATFILKMPWSGSRNQAGLPQTNQAHQ